MPLKKRKRSHYAADVRNEAGDIIQAAESRESVAVLKAKFRELCNPLTNVIIERHKFNTRFQEASEPVQNFITALKILADTCEFGTLKDSLIRDRIVCGVSSDALRKKLLKERDLTLHKAVQLFQIHESAERYSKEVSDQQEVNAVRQQASSAAFRDKACKYCGGCHAPQKELCPAFGKRCSSCMKMHHFSRVCRSTRQRRVNRNVIIVDHDEADMLQEDADIHVITQAKIRNEIHCTARVNTHEIRLKIDTGAKCNVLPLDLFKKVQKRETINKAKAVNLVAYGGERFSTLGTADLQCKIGDTTRLLTFQVLDRQATPILGLKDSLQLNLVKLDMAVYEVDAENAFRQQVVTEYADLFDDQLGNLAARYTKRVDKSVTPVVKPATKIPQAMEKKVKEELGNMVKKVVIVRETEPTEWVSQMVATRKKNGDVRIRLDPRDLIKALKRPHHPMRTADDVASRLGNAKVFSTLDAKAGFWQIKLEKQSCLRTTFSTPYGRYRFLRMPFGINTASEVFQQAMERLFEGYPCAIIVDDILIWGSTEEEHDANLRKVLETARQIGLKRREASPSWDTRSRMKV